MLIYPCWSISHLFRKPIMRTAASWGHEDKAIRALSQLHLGICLGQSQNYSLISLRIGRDSYPGCPESNPWSLTSKQSKPARYQSFILSPTFGHLGCSRGQSMQWLAIMLGPPLDFMDQVSLVFVLFIFFLPDFGDGKRHKSDKFCWNWTCSFLEQTI